MASERQNFGSTFGEFLCQINRFVLVAAPARLRRLLLRVPTARPRSVVVLHQPPRPQIHDPLA